MSNGANEALPRSGAVGFDETGEDRGGFPAGRVLLFVTAWLGGSWLVVGAFIGAAIPAAWVLPAVGIAFGALAAWQVVRGLRGDSYPSAAIRLWLMRPFWYSMFFLPMLAVAAVAGGIFGIPFGAGGVVGRAAIGVTAVALVIAAAVGYADSRRLVVKRLDVRMPRLPEEFDGTRVVQISDLHVGPHTPARFLDRVADAVRHEAPDMIAITGDQVDDFEQDVDRFAAVFGRLPSSLGTYAVPGNHDVYAGWAGVNRGMSEAGIAVLVNDAVAVERNGARLWIAGTGDPAGAGFPRPDPEAAPDIARTLADVPVDEPVVALAHNPALWPELAARGVDLTLSGHTHYGQFAIPGRGWSMASAFLDLAMGWHRRGRSLLYINPGTNYWGIPFRLGTPPEVTVLTLRGGRFPNPGFGDSNASIAEESSPRRES